MTAPQQAMVKIPDNMPFEQAGRFGYIGTSYGALKLAGAGPGQVGLIDGITGTLGVAATVLGLCHGRRASILGTGRDEELLERVKALAPDRIEVLQLGDRPSGEWAKALTGGEGADFVISALGARAPAAPCSTPCRASAAAARSSTSAAWPTTVPIDMKWLMDEQVQIIGSNWFTTAQGQEMADMVETGTLDLSYLEHRAFPLADVNTRDLRAEGPPRRLQQLRRRALTRTCRSRRRAPTSRHARAHARRISDGPPVRAPAMPAGAPHRKQTLVAPQRAPRVAGTRPARPVLRH